MILVNLTAPLEDIGPVNGFGNMLAAGMRALGPALAGQLWALSLAVVDSGAQFVAFGVVGLSLPLHSALVRPHAHLSAR